MRRLEPNFMTENREPAHKEQTPSAKKNRDCERCIPYANRYTAAWAEISQRIMARQQVHIQFATVSVTATAAVIGAAINESPLGFPGIAEWGAIGLVVYSWAFALWIRNNHAVVGLLGAYCKALEDATDNFDETGYAWHTDEQGWIKVARQYGLYSDRAAIILAIVASLPALGFSVWHFMHHEECWLILWALFLLIVAAFGFWAVFFLYMNRSERDKIARYKPEDVRTKGKNLDA